jgi:hypothetical protein
MFDTLGQVADNTAIIQHPLQLLTVNPNLKGGANLQLDDAHIPGINHYA